MFGLEGLTKFASKFVLVWQRGPLGTDALVQIYGTKGKGFGSIGFGVTVWVSPMQ